MATTKTATKKPDGIAKSLEWKDWLNEIQAYIISTGYYEGMTKSGASESASKFLELQHIFTKLVK